MSDNLCLLVTVLYNKDELLRCAIKIPNDFGDEAFKYWREPENKKILESLLPSYVIEDGVIVEVKEIYEVIDKSK